VKGKEGVIKFDLAFTEAPPLVHDLRTLQAWRRLLYANHLIGQDPRRYAGYGYGNISQRVAPFEAPPHERPFVITGGQTGGLPELAQEHYVLVTACYPDRNRVVAEGPMIPSSESMTHGTLYELDDRLRFVIHVHSPEIWQAAAALGLPTTRADVAYGTPEMADEVRRLFRETDVAATRLFAMGGHEDGLVSFGETAEAAGTVLLACLARAYAL
jgi:L-ribulose-5-phosphate 4-epimerase